MHVAVHDIVIGEFVTSFDLAEALLEELPHLAHMLFRDVGMGWQCQKSVCEWDRVRHIPLRTE